MIGRAAAILASFALAAVYSRWSGSAVPGAEVLLISVASGLTVLLVGILAEAFRRQVSAVPWPLVIRNLVLLAGLAAVASLFGFWLNHPDPNRTGWKLLAQCVIVASLSGGVGYGEIISRYRDRPYALLGSAAAFVYIAVNVVAGLGALLLVQTLEVLSTTQAHRSVYEVLLAGFGAIAFFRSSFFTVRVGETDVGVGPSTLLKSLLDASELEVDRWQAVNRGVDAGQIMASIDFEKARVVLPMICFNMLEHPYTPEEQKQIGAEIDKIDDQNIPAANRPSPTAKTLILGVYLIRRFGAEVLRRAVQELGDSIK